MVKLIETLLILITLANNSRPVMFFCSGVCLALAGVCFVAFMISRRQ